MSNFYTEGKATEHPDISGQTEFQSIADKILEKRKKERSILPKKRGVQLPSFVGKVVNKEEVEIGEDYKKLPRERMRDQYDRKKDKNYDEYHSKKSNKNSMYGINRGESDTQIDVHGNSKQTKKIGGLLKNNPSFYEKDHENYSRSASRINQNKFDNNIKILEAHYNPATKKIQAEKPSQEEIDTLAKEAAASGKKKRKPVGSVRKNSATFKPSSPEQAKADMKSWNDYWSGSETIDVGADAGSTISDFVHSKSKTFKGDSKKQRIKRALGAYYGASKESEQKFHNKIDKLVHKTFGKRPEEKKMKEEIENSYECVVEALVEYGFAEDEETANDMIIGLSEGFIGMIFEEYLEEKARGTRPKKTIHAYDVDETLFGHGKKGKPTVQVHVNDSSGKRVQSLSNQDFNTHKLDKDKGHSYDFSEFQSAKKFGETSSPNKKVIKDLRRKQARGQNVHIITARSKFDNPSEFQGHLQKHGIDIPKNKIHYTGGMKGSDVGKKKVDTAKGIVKQSGAKGIHMYDDAAKVNNAFEKEKQNNPTSTKIKTHMVKPRGKSGEVRPRSFRATETQKEQYYIDFGTNVEELREVDTTPYEYWKEFIR